MSPFGWALCTPRICISQPSPNYAYTTGGPTAGREPTRDMYIRHVNAHPIHIYRGPGWARRWLLMTPPLVPTKVDRLCSLSFIISPFFQHYGWWLLRTWPYTSPSTCIEYNKYPCIAGYRLYTGLYSLQSLLLMLNKRMKPALLFYPCRRHLVRLMCLFLFFSFSIFHSSQLVSNRCWLLNKRWVVIIDRDRTIDCLLCWPTAGWWLACLKDDLKLK